VHQFVVIQGCPCPHLIAAYIEIVVEDAHATVESIYRGTDAEAILNAHGKHSQAQLYEMFLHGQGNPANPPGFSTHELKSDGAAYPSVPRGHDLDWWQQGVDVNDSDVVNCIRVAGQHGWHLWRPYPTGSEYHHINFQQEPAPIYLDDHERIARLYQQYGTHPAPVAHNGPLHISEAGIALIAQFEGYVDHRYLDSVGVPTIGFGTTAAVVNPVPATCTRPEAEEWLRTSMARQYEPAINAIGVPLTQNQFDALCSFVYNVGPGGVSAGTGVGRALRARDYRAAADDLLEWDLAGGHPLAGLVRRRQAERQLFLTG
jgi:lysozyme